MCRPRARRGRRSPLRAEAGLPAAGGAPERLTGGTPSLHGAEPSAEPGTCPPSRPRSQRPRRRPGLRHAPCRAEPPLACG